VEKFATTIKNFRQVSTWLFRGGQPNEEEFKQLKDLGIRTVISLRWNMKAIRKERALAEEHGLNFVSIPLSYWILPTRKEIDRFFSILEDEAMRPVFVHCQHGADRTGAFSAMYRIKSENWTADQAYEEMKQAGFHKFKVHQFKWAVYGYANRLERERRAGQRASALSESKT
jgi:protein tyrosine/serine phosphatase